MAGKKYGTRLEVWRGKAQMTSGGLTKNKLTKNVNGKIVSKKKSTQMKRKSNLGRDLIKKKPKRTGRITDLTSKNVLKGKRRRKKVNYAE